MNKGYVIIHRSIIDNDMWFSEPFTKSQAWIDMIMLANGTDKERSIKGKSIKYLTGYIYNSLSDLSKRWQWSKSKVCRFLKNLEENGMIKRVSVDENGEEIATQQMQHYVQHSVQHKSERYVKRFRSAIFLVNYTKFQKISSKSETVCDTCCETDVATDSATTSAIKLIQYITNTENTNTEITNRERVERDKSLSSPPTLQEIKSYISEKKLRIDPDKFFSYYSESGWKDASGKAVKNWKLKAISWSNRENKKTEKTADNFEPRQNDYDSIERELSERTY